MIHKLYEIIRNQPPLKRIARGILQILGLDITTVGNYLGVIDKKFHRLFDGGLDNIKMVNIGGAHFFKRHWGVLDYTGDRYSFILGTVDWEHNLASFEPLPFEGDTIQFFYSSHCLEHIPEQYIKHIFNELWRCLRHGGAVHITVPDFDAGYDALGRRDEAFFEKIMKYDSLEATFVHYFGAEYMVDKITTEEIWENYNSLSKADFAAFVTPPTPDKWQAIHQLHVTWFNFEKMASMLKAAGFESIERIKPGESKYPEMRGSSMGWGFDHRNHIQSFFIEAQKRSAHR